MQVQVHKEHEWLQRLVGNWTYETEAAMGPDQPTQKFTGTETVRSLGGVWIICEGRGEMQCVGTATTIMTLGYDPARKRYIGTFIGSMMTHLWLYDGVVNATGNLLTLDTEGPNFAAEGKMSKYQDLIEFLSNDHRTLSSQTLADNGQWIRFMTAHYRRVQ